MSRTIRPLFAFAIIAALSALSLSPAYAKKKKKQTDEATAPAPAPKIVVVYVEGEDAAPIAADVAAAAPSSVTVGDADAFAKALKKVGAKLPFGRALDAEKTRTTAFELVRKAAKDVGADGVIVVRVRREKAARKAAVWLVETAGGAPSVDTEITLAGKRKGTEDTAAVRDAVAPAFEKFAPPKPPPTPEPSPSASTDDVAPAADEPPPEEAKPAFKRATGEPSRAFFVGRIGVDLAGRSFSYADAQGTNLRGYSVGGVPFLYAGLELYPFAGGHSAALRAIGLTATFGSAVGLKSAAAGGDPISTTYVAYDLGVRVRILTSGTKDPVVGVSATYGATTFTFADAGALNDSVPSVAYKFIRLGADLRVPIKPIALIAAFGYRLVTGAGDVAARFSSASEGGFDLKGGLDLEISKGLLIELVGRLERFGYTFNVQSTDKYVATGATDLFYGGRLGLAYVY